MKKKKWNILPLSVLMKKRKDIEVDRRLFALK